MYHKDGFNLEIDEAGRILYVPDPKLQVRAACFLSYVCNNCYNNEINVYFNFVSSLFCTRGCPLYSKREDNSLVN